MRMIIVALLGLLALPACERDAPMARTGSALDRAGTRTGNALGEAATDTGQALGRAGNWIDRKVTPAR
jgi:hypothetical protein